MAWRRGPLPPNTYQWGGVVPVGADTCGGFYFADFCGDHVKINPGTPDERVLKPDEVAWYDNSIELSPGATGRVKEDA